MKAQQTVIIGAGRTWRIGNPDLHREGSRGPGQGSPLPARRGSGPGSDRGQAWGLSAQWPEDGWEGWACGRRAEVVGTGAMPACPLSPRSRHALSCCCVVSVGLGVLWLLFTLEMPREVEDDQDRMAGWVIQVAA